MNESTRVLLRRALPIAALLVLVGGAALIIDSLKGEPAGDSADGPLAEGTADGRTGEPAADPLRPEWLPGEQADLLTRARRDLRAAGGDSPASVLTLGRICLALPRPRWKPILLELRPELRLALHSGKPGPALEVLDILQRAAEDPDTLAVLADTPFRSVLRASLEHSSPEVRLQAVELLSRLDTPLARADAIKALQDPAQAVRAAAARAYTAFTEPSSAARLCALLRSEKEPSVRVVILKLLGTGGRKLRRPEVHRAERAAFLEGTTAEKLQVLENLRLWRDHDLLAQLLDALDGSEAGGLQQHMLETLLVLRDRRCREPLRAYLEIVEDENLKDLAERVLRAIGG